MPDGVRGLKAVAMAENTGVVSGGEKPDSMGEYIASRGGARPIRKVRSVGRSVDIRRYHSLPNCQDCLYFIFMNKGYIGR